MIKFVTGDIFESDAEAIINTINCVGAMGAGLALGFKLKYPKNYERYRVLCREKKIKVGTLFVSKAVSIATGKPFDIINFPTKIHWKDPSDLKYISLGLNVLCRYIKEHELKSIAIPKLGCKNGGLDWNVVKPVIVSFLEKLEDVEIIIYE